MPFYINNSGWAGAGTPQKAQGGCSCGCDGREPDAAQGAAMVQAMRMVVAHKVDQALERVAPLHAQAKGDAPLTPRGVLSGKPHTAKEQAQKRPYRTRWGEIAREQGKASKPSTSAPLVPRGIMGGGA